MQLIVTIDTEEDASADWSAGEKPVFRGVTHGIRNILQPLFHMLGIRPTYLVSPIVMQDRASVDMLGQLQNVELGSHLHWEQIAPHAERSLQGGVRLLRHMQWDFPPQNERDKLEALTELFVQQFGYRPTSFRAGRYGASRVTGALLRQLGYEVDSSATPHVRWKTPGGQLVDYSRTPEQPYYIDATGDIFKPGNSNFLEVPITIMAQDKIAGQKQAPWLRPTYADRDTMRQMIDIVRDRNTAGTEQPLVMMFHNVEVIAGASPYTQTDDDVAAYLTDMRATLQYALEQGFQPATLTDYARSFKGQKDKPSLHNVRPSPWTAEDNGLGLDSRQVAEAIARHEVSPWHLYIFKERHTRWDVWAICDWAIQHVPKDAAILSAGCGMAYNLYWLAKQGYSDLTGFDIDANAITASREMIEQLQLPLKLSVRDAGDADHPYVEQFDYIEAMNCLMYAEDNYSRFLSAYAKALKPGGYLALDVIDAAYNQIPDNQYHTGDKKKPETERKPSEYKKRVSQQEIIALAAEHGLTPIQALSRDEAVPRVIYIFQKTAQKAAAAPGPVIERLPRVLFYVDAPNWAHDFKTNNIIRHLAHRFDFRKIHEPQLTAADIDWADIVIIYYWKQFVRITHLIPHLAQKIVCAGISCPSDLEDSRRDIAMQTLRLFDCVFVHNQMLHDEYKSQFSKPFFLNQNGVDTQFYTPRSSSKPVGRPLIVGWAGSLTNHGNKRGYHDIILPAIAITEGVELRTAAPEEKLRGPEEMRDFYRGLDVYLVASRVEGTPNPALEAAACGVTVIASAVGNMPELIRQDENGFLVERTPAAFSDKLAQLRDDPALLQKMKTRIREDILAWDWSIKAQNYEKMIDDMLQRYRHKLAVV